jgi:hypothetical protein
MKTTTESSPRGGEESRASSVREFTVRIRCSTPAGEEPTADEVRAYLDFTANRFCDIGAVEILETREETDARVPK